MSVIYAECNLCRVSFMLASQKAIYAEYHFAECRSAECRYTEYCYAECPHAECHGTCNLRV